MAARSQPLTSIDQLKQVLLGSPRLYTSVDEMRHLPTRRQFSVRLSAADSSRRTEGKLSWWLPIPVMRRFVYKPLLDIVFDDVVDCRFVYRGWSDRPLERPVYFRLTGIEHRGRTLVIAMRRTLTVWLWVERVAATATWLTRPPVA